MGSENGKIGLLSVQVARIEFENEVETFRRSGSGVCFWSWWL